MIITTLNPAAIDTKKKSNLSKNKKSIPKKKVSFNLPEQVTTKIWADSSIQYRISSDGSQRLMFKWSDTDLWTLTIVVITKGTPIPSLSLKVSLRNRKRQTEQSKTGLQLCHQMHKKYYPRSSKTLTTLRAEFVDIQQNYSLSKSIWISKVDRVEFFIEPEISAIILCWMGSELNLLRLLFNNWLLEN